MRLCWGASLEAYSPGCGGSNSAIAPNAFLLPLGGCLGCCCKTADICPPTVAHRATNSAPSWRRRKDPDGECLQQPPPLLLLSPGFIPPGPSLPLCPANSRCPPGSSPQGGPRWPRSGYCPNACGEESTNCKTRARAEKRKEEPGLVQHSHHHPEHLPAPPQGAARKAQGDGGHAQALGGGVPAW